MLIIIRRIEKLYILAVMALFTQTDEDREKFCVRVNKSTTSERMCHYMNSQKFNSTAEIMEAMKDSF